MKASKSGKPKTLRHFGSRLINVAANDHHWNMHALVNLFRLVYEELNFDSKSSLKCLMQLHETASPKMIASLMKRKIVEFTIKEILDVMIEQAKTLDDLCRLIEECIQQEVFNLNSKDTLFELRSIITKVNMNETDVKYYQAFLCDQCPTKATVGRLLYFFIGPPNQDSTSSLSMLYDNVKLTTIYEIMTSHTFRALSGSLHSFYRELKHCEQQLHNMLNQNNMLDKNGNFNKDLDMDSDGDLRDFITSSSDESSDGDNNSVNSKSSTDSEITASTTGPQVVTKVLMESKHKDLKTPMRNIATKKPHQTNSKKRRKMSVESEEEHDQDDNDFVIRSGKKYSKSTIQCFDNEAEESSSEDETI